MNNQDLAVIGMVGAWLVLAALAVFSQSHVHTDGTQLVQAGAAAISALFACLLLLVTRSLADIAKTQLSITTEQTYISKRQIELEERRFAAEHRPRLLMINTSQIYLDEGVYVRFAIINVGATSADIELLAFTYQVYHRSVIGAAAGTTETGNIPGGRRTLAPGEPVEYEHLFTKVGSSFAQRADDSFCVFSGTAIYFPEWQSNPRFTLGFSRESLGRNPNLCPSDNPMREYSY